MLPAAARLQQRCCPQRRWSERRAPSPATNPPPPPPPLLAAAGDVFIPRGVAVPALDQSIAWEFAPTAFKVGDRITGGDIYATVKENTLMDHKVRPWTACGDRLARAPASFVLKRVCTRFNTFPPGCSPPPPARHRR